MIELTRERKEILEILFATNPELKKIFLTSDDQGFTEEHRANAWERTLSQGKPEVFYRDNLDKIKEVFLKALTSDSAPAAGGFKSALTDQGGAILPPAVTAETPNAPVVTEDKKEEGGEGEGQHEQGGDQIQEVKKTEPEFVPETDIKLAREKYKAAFDKNPSNAMTLEILNKKLAEAPSSK